MSLSPHLSQTRIHCYLLWRLIRPVLAIITQFGTLVTRVEATVHKVKVVVILETGSLVNFIYYWLAQNIKMTPDLDHAVVY